MISLWLLACHGVRFLPSFSVSVSWRSVCTRSLMTCASPSVAITSSISSPALTWININNYRNQQPFPQKWFVFLWSYSPSGSELVVLKFVICFRCWLPSVRGLTSTFMSCFLVLTWNCFSICTYNKKEKKCNFNILRVLWWRLKMVVGGGVRIL